MHLLANTLVHDHVLVLLGRHLIVFVQVDDGQRFEVGRHAFGHLSMSERVPVLQNAHYLGVVGGEGHAVLGVLSSFAFAMLATSSVSVEQIDGSKTIAAAEVGVEGSRPEDPLLPSQIREVDDEVVFIASLRRLVSASFGLLN